MGRHPDDVELKKALKTLRDEVRLRVHLAGMDAREAFERVEKDAERLVSGATRHAMSELIERLEKIRRAIPSVKS